MKKTLDNEKAFRICADQEIKNLKEQLKCSSNKYKALENENEKLISDKLKMEEAKNKISQQCNELIQKNISLENHCEKKECAFDEQTNLMNLLENNITELKEKINKYNETEEENIKLVKQMKSFSKQMENYENEREVYVQRLQEMQREENELKNSIKDLKKKVEFKRNEIINLNEINSNLSSKNCKLISNINSLKNNFANCLKLLDDIFDNYVKNNKTQTSQVQNDESAVKLKPFLNDAFQLLEQSLTEFKLIKSFYKDSEINLKDEINKKENTITLLRDKIENYEQDATNNLNHSVNFSQNAYHENSQNKLVIADHSNLISELEKNLSFINQIKVEVLPKQKLLFSECKKFMSEKLIEISSINNLRHNYVKNVFLKIDHLLNEIDNKNTTINELKNEVSKLGERVTEKDALCNEMEIELHHYRENFGI